VEVILEDGRLVDVQPFKGAPFGNLCVRGKHGPEIVYSKDRLKTPLIRVGERGEGKFREAGWDEALDYTVRKMQEIKDKYGPQALISHSGRGAFEQSMLDFCNSKTDMVASKLLLPFGYLILPVVVPFALFPSVYWRPWPTSVFRVLLLSPTWRIVS
jgi:hypothetical protein